MASFFRGLPRWFLAQVLFMLAVQIVVLFYAPLGADEAYYWSWAKAPALSYFDHPPGIAWFIRIGTSIFGDSVLGIRFLGPVVFLLVALLLARLSLPTPVLGLSLFCPLLFVYPVFQTPDVPLLLFWTLYFFWTIRATESLEKKSALPLAQWAVGGLWLGLGLLGKYTMVLAVGGSFLAFVRCRPLKGWVLGWLITSIVHLFTDGPQVFNGKLWLMASFGPPLSTIRFAPAALFAAS